MNQTKLKTTGNSCSSQSQLYNHVRHFVCYHYYLYAFSDNLWLKKRFENALRRRLFDFPPLAQARIRVVVVSPACPRTKDDILALGFHQVNVGCEEFPTHKKD
jgi:hypothetical protein